VKQIAIIQERGRVLITDVAEFVREQLIEGVDFHELQTGLGEDFSREPLNRACICRRLRGSAVHRTGLNQLVRIVGRRNRRQVSPDGIPIFARGSPRFDRLPFRNPFGECLATPRWFTAGRSWMRPFYFRIELISASRISLVEAAGDHPAMEAPRSTARWTGRAGQKAIGCQRIAQVKVWG